MLICYAYPAGSFLQLPVSAVNFLFRPKYAKIFKVILNHKTNLGPIWPSTYQGKLQPVQMLERLNRFIMLLSNGFLKENFQTYSKSIQINKVCPRLRVSPDFSVRDVKVLDLPSCSLPLTHRCVRHFWNSFQTLLSWLRIFILVAPALSCSSSHAPEVLLMDSSIYWVILQRPGHLLTQKTSASVKLDQALKRNIWSNLNCVFLFFWNLNCVQKELPPTGHCLCPAQLTCDPVFSLFSHVSTCFPCFHMFSHVFRWFHRLPPPVGQCLCLDRLLLAKAVRGSKYCEQRRRQIFPCKHNSPTISPTKTLLPSSSPRWTKDGG